MESSSKSKIFRKFVFFNEKRCSIQSNEEMKKLYYVKSVHFSAQWWDLPVIRLVYTVEYRPDGKRVNPTSVQCTEISVKVDLPQTIFPCKVVGKSKVIHPKYIWKKVLIKAIWADKLVSGRLACTSSKTKILNNGILLPKLFWPTVRKNCSSDREKLLKFEAEGREFSKILRSLEQFIQTVKGPEQILVTECFFNLFLEVSQI